MFGINKLIFLKNKKNESESIRAHAGSYGIMETLYLDHPVVKQLSLITDNFLDPAVNSIDSGRALLQLFNQPD